MILLGGPDPARRP